MKMRKKDMKKVSISLLITLVIAILVSQIAEIDISAKGKFFITIDGKPVNFTGDLGYPYLTKTQRTMVPIRIISENMGYNVDWSKDTWHQGIRKVWINNNTNRIELEIGKSTAIVNGKSVPIDRDEKTGEPVDTKAELVGSRTYVPLRFITEAMGGIVEYERKDGNHYINIITGKDVEKPEKPTKVTTVTTKQAELTKVGEGYNQHIVDLAKKYNYSTMNLGEGHYFDYKKNQKNGFIEPVIQLDAESNNGFWFTFSIMNKEEYKGKNYEIKFECTSNPEYTKEVDMWGSMDDSFYTSIGLPKEFGAKRGDVVKYEISIRNGKTTKVYPFTIKLGGMHEVE